MCVIYAKKMQKSRGILNIIIPEVWRSVDVYKIVQFMKESTNLIFCWKYKDLPTGFNA